MKIQQVNVDYWSMLKAMVMYGALTALVWFMLRLFNTVFTLPGRLRAQQENMQKSLADLQRRYPDLNITEEDLKNAEKELEALTRGEEDSSDDNDGVDDEVTVNKLGGSKQKTEDKKTI